MQYISCSGTHVIKVGASFSILLNAVFLPYHLSDLLDKELLDISLYGHEQFWFVSNTETLDATHTYEGLKTFRVTDQILL